MKLNIKNPNQKLSLKSGELNIREGLQFESDIFNMSDFKNFEPEVVLHSDNYMYMDNYQEFKNIIGDLDFFDGHGNNVVLELGVIIARGSRPSKRKSQNLGDLIVDGYQPKNAAVCWGGTSVGQPKGGDIDPNKPQYKYLRFRIDWTNGKVISLDENQNEYNILDEIYPVPITISESPLIRKQDWKLKYYFMGLVIRYKKNGTSSSRNNIIRTKYSSQSICISYSDVGVIKQQARGYKYIKPVTED